MHAQWKGVQLRPTCVTLEHTTIRTKAANKRWQPLLQTLFLHFGKPTHFISPWTNCSWIYLRQWPSISTEKRCQSPVLHKTKYVISTFPRYVTFSYFMSNLRFYPEELLFKKVQYRTDTRSVIVWESKPVSAGTSEGSRGVSTLIRTAAGSFCAFIDIYECINISVINVIFITVVF